MKKIIPVLLLSFCLVGCDESSKTDTQINDNKATTASKNNTTTEITKKNSFINIEFEQGPLKGSHSFTINAKQMTSNIGARIDKQGYSDINGNNLFNKDEDRLAVFNRLINQQIKKGSNSPYSKDCGGMTFHDRDNVKPNYNKIYVNFTECTPTQITTLTSWKDNSPYQQRGIEGNFTDTVSLEINTDDGNQEVVTSSVKVSFRLLQKEIKK